MIYTSDKEEEAVRQELEQRGGRATHGEVRALAEQRKLERLIDDAEYGELEPREAVARLAAVVRWLYERA